MAISLKTKKRLIKELQSKLEYKFHYRFIKMTPTAQCHMTKSRLEFKKDLKRTKAQFISDILHEYIHLWAYKKRYWAAYHSERSRNTRKQNVLFVQTAWRAEMWTEWKAAKVMKELYPHLTYEVGYDTNDPKDKQWFDAWMVDPIRECIKNNTGD